MTTELTPLATAAAADPPPDGQPLSPWWGLFWLWLETSLACSLLWSACVLLLTPAAEQHLVLPEPPQRPHRQAFAADSASSGIHPGSSRCL